MQSPYHLVPKQDYQSQPTPIMGNENSTMTSPRIENGIIKSNTVEIGNPLLNEHLQGNGKIPGKPTSLHHIDSKYRLHLLASVVDRDHLCPIHYSNDYLPQRPQWLVPQQVSFDQIQPGSKHFEKKNSIPLHLADSGLPTHTGIRDFRQSKYWESVVQVTTELLELFAADRSFNELTLSTQPKPTINNDSNVENHDTNGVGVQKNHTRSMATLALEELNKGVLDTWCRFTIYMWPDADEERIKLAAQTGVVLFMFDGMFNFMSSHIFCAGMRRERPKRKNRRGKEKSV